MTGEFEHDGRSFTIDALRERLSATERLQAPKPKREYYTCLDHNGENGCEVKHKSRGASMKCVAKSKALDRVTWFFNGDSLDRL